MRVLGVIRLSREADESTSPERQRAGLMAWATSLGHTIVGWAEDLDVSGKVAPWDRDKLGPWLGDSPPESFDIIAATKIDRLSRDLGDFVDLINWAAERGKYVVAYMDSVDTSTSTGDLVAKVLAIFAEFERKTIAKRNADSQQHAREQGRWHGGTPPYGYMPQKQSSGKGFTLAIDPESSERVREIVRRILKGESMNAICNDFNAREIPTPSDHYRLQVGKKPQGHRWKTTALNPILRSKMTLGIAEKDGQVVLDPEDNPVKRAEAIVSREDWDNVQHQLDLNMRLKTRSATSSFLLNIVYCADCGLPCYRLISGPVTAKRRRSYYRCRGRAEHLNNCLATSVRADTLESLVEEIFLAAAGDFEVMKRVVLPAESHVEELRQAQESLDYLLNEVEDKPEAVRKVYAPRIARQEERINRLSALPERPQRVELRGTGQTFRQVWDDSDTTERRKILKDAGLVVFTTPRPDSATEAVKEHWEKLTMTQGNRHMVELEPSDTGSYRAWLVWHGDLAARIKAKLG